MSMSRAEMFRSNLALAKQHLLHVLQDPAEYAWIPEGAHVIVLPVGKPRLFAENMRFAQELARKGDGKPIILLPELRPIATHKRVRTQTAKVGAIDALSKV